MDMMEIRRQMMGVIAQMAGWKFIKSYTVPESWTTDTKGNPVTIFNTVMAGEQIEDDPNILYYFVFLNNEASTSYKADYCIYPSINSPSFSSNAGIAMRNNKTVTRAISTTTSFYVTQGTTINVYKIQLPNN